MSEINTNYPDNHEESLEVSDRVLAAASMRGYPLQPSRLDSLTSIAKRCASVPEGDRIVFNENGLMVKRPLMMGISGVKPGQISYLDFLPIVEGSDIVANSLPQRGSTTAITLMGIEAFQDFVLLADSGLVPKPDKFFGTTNPTMANFARRIGFESTPKLEGGVIAGYDVVAERVFSSEVLDIQNRLTERQAVVRAGQLALAS